MKAGGRPVALVGTGYSTVGRNTGLSLRELSAESIDAALVDAGLTPNDVDGIAIHSFPHMAVGVSEVLVDTGIPGASWISGSTDGPAGITAAIHAAAAVAAGVCDVAVAVRTVHRIGASGEEHGGTASGYGEFTQPFGGGHPTHWAGMFMRRMMHDFGWTEESFGRQMVAQRQFATLNPRALLRQPMTLDDYLAQRYVSRPLRVVDCDYPVDASGTLIFTTAERARDLRHRPVQVEAYGFGLHRWSFEQTPDMARSSPHAAAEAMWRRTDLRPADIDVAGLYDGFSPIVLNWIEALGIVGRGEAADFVAEGHTGPGGSLPVNCDGGATNVGRIHGINHVAEVVSQLRGDSGDRQKPGATVGVATGSIGPQAGCMLLVAGDRSPG